MFSSILQKRGCPHYWWHQVLYGMPLCHYLPLLTLATHPRAMVFTIWGHIGNPNHYVSQMVKCFTNILGMSFKTYPTIGSTIPMYTYLCTYLGSSLKLVLHKGFLIPCTKAQSENNGMCPKIDHSKMDISTNWIEKQWHVQKCKLILGMSNWNWYMGDFLECFVWSSMDHSKNNFRNNYLIIWKPNYITFS
jgi:hypothetical protein